MRSGSRRSPIKTIWPRLQLLIFQRDTGNLTMQTSLAMTPECSVQLIPGTALSFSSATAGGAHHRIDVAAVSYNAALKTYRYPAVPAQRSCNPHSAPILFSSCETTAPWARCHPVFAIMNMMLRLPAALRLLVNSSFTRLRRSSRSTFGDRRLRQCA